MSASRQPLSEAALAEAVGELHGWQLTTDGDGAGLHRTFQFPDFVTAWAFMTAAALQAERLDHHPEWSNVYGTVEVTLRTHNPAGVSQLDVQLAQHMDRIAAGLNSDA